MYIPLTVYMLTSLFLEVKILSMKKIQRITFMWRLLLRKILTALMGAASFLFGACPQFLIYGGEEYGMPPMPEYGMPEPYQYITGTVVDNDEKPVPGFKISILCEHDHNFYTLTNSNGEFTFYFYKWNAHEDGCYTLFFQDVDGLQNGEYNSKTVQWCSGDEPLRIVLEPKESTDQE